MWGDEIETKKKGLTEVNAGRKKGIIAYLPRHCHKNRLESLSTTAAPPSKGRKSHRVTCSFPSPSPSPSSSLAAFSRFHCFAKWTVDSELIHCSRCMWLCEMNNGLFTCNVNSGDSPLFISHSDSSRTVASNVNSEEWINSRSTIHLAQWRSEKWINSLSTVHVNNGERLHCSWARPGPA